MRAVLVLGALALALAACGGRGATEREAAADQATADQAAADFSAAVAPPPAVLSRTAVEIYPNAVEVRLVTIEHTGKVTDTGRGPLTRAQRQAIEGTMSMTNYGPGNGAAAACFVPHHFLEYYDASGKQVGEIAICFCCAGIRENPVIEPPLLAGADHSELTFDRDALKTVFDDMGVPTNIGCSDEQA